MFFLKKNSNSSIEPSSESTFPNQNLSDPNEPSALFESSTSGESETPYENLSLFHRFMRNKAFYSGPEFSYEDEAWAPEFQSVRLFHKQWGTEEDQNFLPTDSQSDSQ